MSRKRKRTAEEWEKEFPDDLMVAQKTMKNKQGEPITYNGLFCKFCCNEFTFNNKISNRIREHLFDSKRHKKQKEAEQKRQHLGNQLAFAETQTVVTER